MDVAFTSERLLPIGRLEKLNAIAIQQKRGLPEDHRILKLDEKA